jgi:hypothetical protein
VPSAHRLVPDGEHVPAVLGITLRTADGTPEIARHGGSARARASAEPVGGRGLGW